MILRALFIFAVLLSTQSCYHTKRSDIFESKFAGIEIEKPSDWLFVSSNDYFEGMERVKYINSKFDDSLIRKKSTAPLVVLAKYKEPYEDVNPTVRVIVRPMDNHTKNNPLKSLGDILAFIKSNKLFKNFKVIQNPVKTELAKKTAYYVSANYDMMTKDGGIHPTSIEMWIIPRENYLIMVGSGYKQNEITEKKETESILQSLVIK